MKYLKIFEALSMTRPKVFHKTSNEGVKEYFDEAFQKLSSSVPDDFISLASDFYMMEI
jgi:hypothetical protein